MRWAQVVKEKVNANGFTFSPLSKVRWHVLALLRAAILVDAPVAHPLGFDAYDEQVVCLEQS